MSGPNLELESLGHELLFAIDMMQRQRIDLVNRIERIAAVANSIKRLLPSTREAISRAAKGGNEHE